MRLAVFCSGANSAVACMVTSMVTFCRYTESVTSFGVLQGASGLSSSLEGKLMMEREALYSELVAVRAKMVR